jgi:hypothetical protein
MPNTWIGTPTSPQQLVNVANKHCMSWWELFSTLVNATTSKTVPASRSSLRSCLYLNVCEFVVGHSLQSFTILSTSARRPTLPSSCLSPRRPATPTSEGNTAKTNPQLHKPSVITDGINQIIRHHWPTRTRRCASAPTHNRNYRTDAPARTRAGRDGARTRTEAKRRASAPARTRTETKKARKRTGAHTHRTKKARKRTGARACAPRTLPHEIAFYGRCTPTTK